MEKDQVEKLQLIGGNYLVTSDAWFFAQDGKQYKAAWGKIEVLSDKILGIDTNRAATNWYMKIGDDDNHVIFAGCQIHYAMKCNDAPNSGPALEFTADDIVDGKAKEYSRPSMIYIAQQE